MKDDAARRKHDIRARILTLYPAEMLTYVFRMNAAFQVREINYSFRQRKRVLATQPRLSLIYSKQWFLFRQSGWDSGQTLEPADKLDVTLLICG